MRCLIIEDDTFIAGALRITLRNDGASVHTTETGEEGVSLAKHYDYDVILLDMGLPDMSGTEVLRRLRAAKVSTPVLIVSGTNDTDTMISALSCGADDYMVKPINNYELIARIRAVVRRSKGWAQSVITLQGFTIDLDSKTVEANGVPVPLSAKEYQILELLCLRNGATLSKEVFLNHLYDQVDEPDSKVIDVFICNLRRKLAAKAHGENPIETVWGRGYLVRGAARAITPKTEVRGAA